MSKSLNYEEATWVKKTQATRGLGHARPGFFFFFCFFFLFFFLGSYLVCSGFFRSRVAWVSLLSLFLVFFFLFPSLCSYLICFGFFSIFIRVVNRVLKTRFSCGHHVKKYATLDHIRPWKLSLKDSIYRPKSSLIDSRC